jgi:transposase-like protein
MTANTSRAKGLMTRRREMEMTCPNCYSDTSYISHIKTKEIDTEDEFAVRLRFGCSDCKEEFTVEFYDHHGSIDVSIITT